MTILGCDYSSKAIHFGWGSEWRTFPVNEDLDEFMLQIKMYLPNSWDNGHLFIERPWARYNIAVGLQMQRISTIIDVIATQAGYTTHWVTPAQWRSKVFGKGKYPTKIAKQMAIDIIKDKLKLDVDDNAADALCLSIYGEAVLADV